MDNVNLDDWIGKQVGVLFMLKEEEEEPQRAGCTLESADERGIILSYHDAADLSQRAYFFPWHRIEFIHRMTE